MKFVVDAMLGNLARWLRMLGYDTLYSRKAEDWRILRVAEKSSRIIVTRDVGLFRKARKKGLEAVLISTDDVSKMLAQLSLEVGVELKFNPSNTRCPKCNTLLERMNKAEALSLLPKDLGVKYEDFWRCPKCRKIYWQGNHWKTISETLDEALRLKAGLTSNGKQ